MFTGWLIPDSDLFGPYELLNFTLGYYANVISNGSKSGLSTGAVVGIVFGAVAVAITLSAVITMYIMKRFSRYNVTSRKRSVSRIPMKIEGLKSFTFQEMSQATNNFSSTAQVGQGFKGVFTEIELLSRLHHRNLVSLLGYCDEEDEQMLVYEFMPNGTLRDHLSAKSKNEPLNFSMRLRIALGSSRGILYLHSEADPPIFHRDIKATNILLDAKFIAKVADFGLSRLAPVPEVEGTVPGYVSTVVKGTPGYLDPEYFLTHKLTDKSDVYSLGVVFLELLTGMQPISHGKNIVREVTVSYQSGMMFSVVDNRMGSYPSECIERFVALALRCCQEETDKRPPMSEVVRELENIWHMTPESDSVPSESMVTDSVKSSTPTSTSFAGNTYVSTDVSGSDLLSGVIPTITPR
ncbi:hypothetical protein J5N97_013981 [Dioscorea zingiberensis]|uniref:non-specific serine/threonine protein kinase n=1 Tax=Dioscorea zingiberensis TaxID=325984 RepID=A0A9D5CU00_9LILI|nr:hypothetical protein J5N97_013981 [Dioscorea zingiberensis]